MSSGPQEPRLRHDPRAEPEEEQGGPTDAPSVGSMKAHDDQVYLPSGRPPMNALGASEKMKAAGEGAETAEEEGPPSKRQAITVVDPRLAEIEPLIGRGDWSAVARQLGPFEKAGALPPQLGLMYAIAVNEAPQSVEGEDASALAIRCVASMCGVPESSGFALVIAKRLLRKNPVSFRARQAPPARTSLLIVALTLIVGSAVGYFLSSGRFHLPH